MEISPLQRQTKGWLIEKSFPPSRFSARECQWLSPTRGNLIIPSYLRTMLGLTGYTAEDVLGRNCRLLQGEATSKTGSPFDLCYLQE